MSRYAGQYEHVFEATTAGVTLQAPQLDINTVAAGGGSRLFFRFMYFLSSAYLFMPDDLYNSHFLSCTPSDPGCLWLDQNLQVHIQDQPATEKVTSLQLFFYFQEIITTLE